VKIETELSNCPMAFYLVIA